MLVTQEQQQTHHGYPSEANRPFSGLKTHRQRRCRDQQNLDASLSRHTLAVRATPHQAWQTKRVEGTGRVAALVRYFKARAVGVHAQIRASLSARLSC